MGTFKNFLMNEEKTGDIITIDVEHAESVVDHYDPDYGREDAFETVKEMAPKIHERLQKEIKKKALM